MKLSRRHVVLAAITVAVAVVAVKWVSIQPRNDRDWKMVHSVLPRADFNGDRVHVRDIRNFSYQSADSFTAAYYDETFDLTKISSLWFLISIFDPNRRGPAHTFLSFGFDDGKFVSVSVEARQERGESYSALSGLFKRFEIIYVIGDEKDLVGTRAIKRTDHVYLYPIRTSRERMRALFVDVLEAANSLHERPLFYNTLTNNCTNRIQDHVNRLATKKIPSSWRTILPGYTDEVAYKLGLIDTKLDLDQAKKRFWINDKAKRYRDHPDFSKLIRESDD